MSAAADDQGRGEDAEGDTFAGIQNIIGSNFDDALTGNGQANTFHGGTDTINGEFTPETTAATSSSNKGRATTIGVLSTLSPVPTKDAARL